MFQNGNKLTSSHLFDVREAVTRNGPIRPSRFLEERKWPPPEMIENQVKDRINLSNKSSDATYLAQPYIWSTKARIIKNQPRPNTFSPIFISDSYEPEFELLTRLEVSSPSLYRCVSLTLLFTSTNLLKVFVCVCVDGYITNISF